MKPYISSYLLKLNNDIGEIKTFEKFYQNYFKIEFLNEYLELSTYNYRQSKLPLDFKITILKDQNKRSISNEHSVIIYNY